MLKARGGAGIQTCVTKSGGAIIFCREGCGTRLVPRERGPKRWELKNSGVNTQSASVRPDPSAVSLRPSGDGSWTAAGASCPCVHPHPANQGKAEPYLLTLMAPLATGPESQPYTFLPHPPQGRDASPPDAVDDEVAAEFAGGGWDRQIPGAPFDDTRKILNDLCVGLLIASAL